MSQDSSVFSGEIVLHAVVIIAYQASDRTYNNMFAFSSRESLARATRSRRSCPQFEPTPPLLTSPVVPRTELVDLEIPSWFSRSAYRYEVSCAVSLTARNINLEIRYKNNDAVKE